MTLAAAVQVRDGGRVLAGGYPFRVLRLTEAGAEAVRAWSTGGPVGDEPGRGALARRLLDAGILDPVPTAASPPGEAAVVIPVRDRPRQLARCLDSVVATTPGAEIVVVDDGSADSEAVAAVAIERGARIVRHERSRGPAAARNSGLAASTGNFVAFIDSDVVVARDWAATLLGHFADPAVAAVAPRVAAMRDGPGLIAGYEARHSSLDMGPVTSAVAPGRPVSYVPSAALVVRRSAAQEGFDERLVVGEDVDFVWRLLARGFTVRYDPRVRVGHDHRVRLGEFVARRREYARSVALLSLRHPDALPAAWLSPWTAAPWGLALAGRPRLAAATWLIAAGLLANKLPDQTPARGRLAARILLRGSLMAGRGLGHAVRRSWLPFLLPAVRRPFVRRAVALAIAAPVVEDASRSGRAGIALRDAPVRLLDECLALTGTWEGCMRHRTLRPLVPAWTSGRARRDTLSGPRSDARGGPPRAP